ncbi:hypothetical protein OG21DRAFT_1484899 [Imleria badia]|nr:hypothetical protein OG21DRAFT_1484899 [Imleria badia]
MIPTSYVLQASNKSSKQLTIGQVEMESALIRPAARPHSLSPSPSVAVTPVYQVLAPVSTLVATERLSQEVEYELEFGWPFGPTADCGVILSLYDNYTVEEKVLIDEDQEDVIQMVQEELGLDKSVRPKWYFDALDPWEPDDEDEDQ